MRGLSKRTTKLGFKVLRLHYSADPDKDPKTLEGKKWYAEARKGMSEARFRQEYEIDYGALGGQLVFPEFDESVHLVHHSSVAIDPAYWTVWMACDPHPRTAHAFVWLAVNREGEMVVPWAWWPEGERFTVKEYAEKLKIVDNSSLNLRPYYQLMDVAGKSFNATEELSYFDAYRDAGVYFNPAKTNRDLSGYDLINDALKPVPFMIGNEEKMKPRLTILGKCGDNDQLAYQLKNLRFREWKGNVTDKDPPEEPEDKRRHLVDCLSYILLDGPRFVEQRKSRSTFEPLYPSLGY
jgi:hypothetical protein